MPAMTGIGLHQHLVAAGEPTPTILVTADFDATRKSALSNGVICYMRKPFNDNELMQCVRTALHGHSQQNDDPWRVD